MKVNMPMAVTAADTIKRTITGTIVSWDEQGNTSVGPTVFAKDSIEIKPVKLLLEHDRTRPIGKMVSHNVTSSGIEATFKIANTMAGEDALVEATEGLRDGFSVGAQINEWTNNKGVMQITSATLDEVSLVTDPAIDSARVAEVVAASENEAPKEDSDLATADSDKPTEGDQVSDTTAPAPAVEEAVEAAKVEAAAPKPAFYTTPRLEFTKAKYLENSIRAALGDDDARSYLRAADNTTDNAGFIPTPQSTTLINGVANGDRGFIDALSRETLAASGMTFELPRINTAPTVALTNEEGAPSETDMGTAYISVDVKKFAGQQTVSVELIDRSSPAFFSELVRQMEFAYAKATDAYAVTRASATATASTAKAGATAANYLAFFANAAKNCYTGSLGFARNVVVSPDVWAEIMGLNDNGRPIYIASNPQNAGGALSPLSIRGNVAGLDLYVSRSLSGTGDGSIYVINPDALTFYESPRLTLQTNVIASGQISVMYYGYAAVAPKLPGGYTSNDNA
jgi:HK97 family phage major capsid protein/HK97 family phage prohead protease